MDQIRPLAERDLQSVADLFISVFRRSAPPAPASLTDFFRRLYLEYPVRRDDIPSLVLESGGRPAGFLGALPLPFSHRGKALTAVVAGNYMVDPEVHDPFAGVRLEKIAAALENVLLHPRREVVLPRSTGMLSLLCNIVPGLFPLAYSLLQSLGRARLSKYRTEQIVAPSISPVENSHVEPL